MNYQIKDFEINPYLTVAFLGLLCGISLWILQYADLGLFALVIAGYRKVGITIFALIPLMVWAVKTWAINKDDQLAFSYIGQQAKEVGFTGTLIGISIMFVSLGTSVKEGNSGSIRMAISGFGQAATSTLLGLLISIFCKHCHFRSLRRQEINTSNRRDSNED